MSNHNTKITHSGSVVINRVHYTYSLVAWESNIPGAIEGSRILKILATESVTKKKVIHFDSMWKIFPTIERYVQLWNIITKSYELRDEGNTPSIEPAIPQ